MRDENGKFIKGHPVSNSGKTQFKKGHPFGKRFEKGMKHTEEWKEKMSKLRKGKKLKNTTPNNNKELRKTIEYSQWREKVIERDDKKCVDCGSKQSLQAHHIVSMKVLPSAALIRANGVTLCKDCHKKTDTWGGGEEVFNSKLQSGDLQYLMKVIPHSWQDYNTVGNYFHTNDDVRVIFVSDLLNPDYEFLIFLHEMVEQYLAFKKGIKEEDIDKFDIEHPELYEPGNNPDAPYFDEHLKATDIESMISVALEVNWSDYETKQYKISKDWKKK